jgi:flagellar motor switch protein FliN/FliY
MESDDILNNNMGDEVSQSASSDEEALARELQEELDKQEAQMSQEAPQPAVEPKSSSMVEDATNFAQEMFGSTGQSYPSNLDMLMDVAMELTVELGRTSQSVRQVLDLHKGSVLELDRIAGDAVDIYVNNQLIAKGDVVVVDDKFGVRITELTRNKREG